MFQKAYNVDDDKFFDKVKKLEACSLPPCKSELKQQILRAAYVSNIWNNAFKTIIVSRNPSEYGWKEEEDDDGNVSYNFKWFEGDQFPANVKDVILPQDTTDPENSAVDSGKNLYYLNIECALKYG